MNNIQRKIKKKIIKEFYFVFPFFWPFLWIYIYIVNIKKKIFIKKAGRVFFFYYLNYQLLSMVFRNNKKIHEQSFIRCANFKDIQTKFTVKIMANAIILFSSVLIFLGHFQFENAQKIFIGIDFTGIYKKNYIFCTISRYI